MEFFKLFIMKNIFGFFLQGFVLVFGIYTFNRQNIIFKDYIIASILVIILTYIMKLVPITAGVQMILNMMFLFLICIMFLKMPAYTTLRSTSFCVIIILISEMTATAIVIKSIGQEQFEVLINDSMQRYYIGVLANIIFAIIIILAHGVFRRKGDNHRNISSQNS